MNTQQRKALEKIVLSRIGEKKDLIQDQKEIKIKEMAKQVELTNKPKAKKLLAEKLRLDERGEKIDEQITELGFEYNRYDEKLFVDLSKEQNDKINKEFSNKERELDKVAMRLQAKVWGVETDFDSLMKAIEKELGKI